MKLIVFNIFAIICDIAGIVRNYSLGRWGWVILLSLCAGAVFQNTLWLIKEKVEEKER